MYGVFLIAHHDHTFTMIHGRFNTLGNAVAVVRIGNDAVHYNFDVVGLVAIYLHFRHHFHHHTIYPHTGEAHLSDLHKELPVMSFSTLYYRGQDDEFAPGKVADEVIDDLVLRLADHLLTCIVGISFTGPGIEQAHEVINLCKGAYCGSWVLGGGFLLNGDDRAQAVDLVNIGPFHVANKGAGIGRKAFHVPALALSINSIESQG